MIEGEADMPSIRAGNLLILIPLIILFAIIRIQFTVGVPISVSKNKGIK